MCEELTNAQNVVAAPQDAHQEQVACEEGQSDVEAEMIKSVIEAEHNYVEGLGKPTTQVTLLQRKGLL